MHFDEPPTLEKKPGCPDGFVWHGEAHRVVKGLSEWHDYGHRGRMARSGWSEADRVQRTIAVAGLALGVGGPVFGIAWLLDDGSPLVLPPDVAAQVEPLATPDPSRPRSYTVKTLFYGSGQDRHRAEYGAIVYGRGPLFVAALAEEMGQKPFDEFLHDYYQSHKWGIGTSAAFRQLAEQHCQCDLTALFEEWVYDKECLKSSRDLQ